MLNQKKLYIFKRSLKIGISTSFNIDNVGNEVVINDEDGELDVEGDDDFNDVDWDFLNLSIAQISPESLKNLNYHDVSSYFNKI